MKIFIARIISQYFKKTQFLINIRFVRKKIIKQQHHFANKILDIGAGEKPYKEIFEFASEYIGTNSKRHYEINKLNIDKTNTDVWVEDATKLPFDNNSFDGIVCFQVLSVINNPKMFFNEVERVLKPNGYFMLSTDFLYPKWSDEDFMRLTDFHLRKLCEENSFEIISMESSGGFFTMWYSLFIRFVRSYPAILSNRNGIFRKILGSLFFLIMALLSPIVSVFGLMIYAIEKNITDEFDYTMSLFLVGKKKG